MPILSCFADIYFPLFGLKYLLHLKFLNWAYLNFDVFDLSRRLRLHFTALTDKSYNERFNDES